MNRRKHPSRPRTSLHASVTAVRHFTGVWPYRTADVSEHPDALDAILAEYLLAERHGGAQVRRVTSRSGAGAVAAQLRADNRIRIAA